MEEKNEVRKQFSQTAESYLVSGIHSKGQDLPWIKEIVSSARKKRGLDIATGAGHTAFTISPHLKEVVALDLTPQMIQIASEEAQRRNLTNIHFILGDVDQIPYPDASFDLVTCRIAAHHFVDIKKAISEVYRVLQPEGLFLLIDNYVPSVLEDGELINQLEKLRDDSHVACLTLERWRELLEQEGFINVQAKYTWSTPVHLPEWLERAKTPQEKRKEIVRLVEENGTHPWIDHDEIHLHKVMWLCEKSSN